MNEPKPQPNEPNCEPTGLVAVIAHLDKLRSGAAKPSFPLGQQVMTACIAAKIKEDAGFRFEVAFAMARHIACDWREMSDDDAKANLAAITGGTRIFSSYKTKSSDEFGYDKIWIITEADRSVTTVLFPHEY